MKRINIISKFTGLLFLISFVLLSCSEEPVGQTATNKTPPPPLTNVKVTPTYGGAYVTYSLPDEKDISYVKCEFTYNGKTRTVRSSIYKNYLEIDGLGEPEEIELKMYVVNHSEITSVVHIEKFVPLEAPMSFILHSFRIEPAYGGVTITWENPTMIMAGISFLAADDNGTLELKDIVFSSLPFGTKKMRGFNTNKRLFAMCISDKYENVSDTFKIEVTPLYEMELDKSKFKRVPLTADQLAVSAPPVKNLHDITNSNHDNRPIEKIWDGIGNAAGEESHYTIWHTWASGWSIPLYFTIDLGIESQLTRIVVYNRSGDNGDYLYPYAQHNLRRFEVWGTNELKNTTVNPQGYQISESPYWDNNDWQADWSLLADCEIIRPSGNSPGALSTPEDIDAHIAGFEFEFRQGVPKTRYLRFIVNETWARTAALHLSEISIFGDDR
ncbi:MAG: DUF4959 domain-containing protein [Tannerella sp.]|jgi:hypothetical protein|nr:DUF4959 domain-containing protein [Tannerella sp.]